MNRVVTLESTYMSEEDISRIAGISHESAEGPGLAKLLEWGHTSPLEFAHVTLYIEAPIFVARQWFRHRTFSYMEKSGRYTKMNDFYSLHDEDEESNYIFENAVWNSYASYLQLIERGLPKEQARAVLPLGTITKFYVQADLRNLTNFMQLRLTSHAQKEIREFAKDILHLLEREYPIWANWIKSTVEIG